MLMGWPNRYLVNFTNKSFHFNFKPMQIKV
jgi:hypothetical protein